MDMGSATVQFGANISIRRTLLRKRACQDRVYSVQFGSCAVGDLLAVLQLMDIEVKVFVHFVACLMCPRVHVSMGFCVLFSKSVLREVVKVGTAVRTLTRTH